jgi:threonine dehydratase
MPASSLVTRDDVLRAAAVVRGAVRRTPLLDAEQLGTGVRLKAELLQHTGSFKARGVTNRLAALGPEERERGVIGVSAGNHAAALAWGAERAGVDCVVVMWASASPYKIARARSFGAHVDLAAADPTEAFARLHELVAETGRVVVHPFDDPLVIAGQGTVGLEIVEDAPDADAIVVPVGGGGLVSGIAAAVGELGVRVIAVEPEESAALALALAAGRPVSLEPRTMADGLSAPFAGERALATCVANAVESVLVREDEIADAMRRCYADAKLACEPAGAAGLAALLAGRVDAAAPVVVVSGGNVSPETASAILAPR